MDITWAKSFILLNVNSLSVKWWVSLFVNTTQLLSVSQHKHLGVLGIPVFLYNVSNWRLQVCQIHGKREKYLHVLGFSFEYQKCRLLMYYLLTALKGNIEWSDSWKVTDSLKGFGDYWSWTFRFVLERRFGSYITISTNQFISSSDKIVQKR